MLLRILFGWWGLGWCFCYGQFVNHWFFFNILIDLIACFFLCERKPNVWNRHISLSRTFCKHCSYHLISNCVPIAVQFIKNANACWNSQTNCCFSTCGDLGTGLLSTFFFFFSPPGLTVVHLFPHQPGPVSISRYIFLPPPPPMMGVGSGGGGGGGGSEIYWNHLSHQSLDQAPTASPGNYTCT